MPPPISESEPSDSEASVNEDVILPKSITAKGKEPMKNDGALRDADGDEEMGEDAANGADGDDEEEFDYVVEDIVGHTWERGVLKFEVKWENWPSTDNTWEPEENLESAVDTLEEYFKKIGGRPEKGSKANSAKKRGRQSVGNGATDRSDSKRVRTENGSGRSRPGRRGARATSVDVTPKVEDDWPKRSTKAWQPPNPSAGSPGNWEDLLLKVETVMCEADGTKWAYLLWAAEDENGKKVTTKARLQSVYVAAPQAMLNFYESHLVFTSSNGKQKAKSSASDDESDGIED